MLVSFSSPTFFLLTIRTISNRNIAHAHQSRAEPILEVTTAVGESPTDRGEPGGSGKKERRNLGREKMLFAFTVGGRDIRKVGVFSACHRGVR